MFIGLFSRVRRLEVALALMLVVPALATAQITIDFTSPTYQGDGPTPSDPVALNGVEEDGSDAIPIQITIDTDGAGLVDAVGTAVFSNNLTISDNWTISGGSSLAADQLFSITMRSIGDPIRQRDPRGIGVNGNNSGKIDNIDEEVEFALDLSGLPGSVQFQLVSVGYDNTNSLPDVNPDLTVTDFDGVTTFIEEDIHNNANVEPPYELAPGDVVLRGGQSGAFLVGLTDTFGGTDSANAGYRLASVAFEFVEVPLLAGDFNLDGVVDAADYTVWRNDGPGEPEDYDLWADNYGLSDATAPPAAIPEPVSATVALFGVAVGCGWRESRRGRLHRIPKRPGQRAGHEPAEQRCVAGGG